jgi:flavin reductase (DIM6/NTAB) family NADH-FMN oxidoreductase RutF
MSKSPNEQLVSLDLHQPIWERFFSIAPLVIIGTREPEGSYDLAPKHMAMPLGWENYFGFICTPAHRTYQNIRRQGTFTVSFPRPDQVVLASLSAAPRCDDRSKPSLAALPTFPATVVDGVFLQDAYLFLECELDRIVDGFGANSLIAGKIVAACVQPEALRVYDRDDGDLLSEAPLLAYISPGRYAQVERSFSFPFHCGFKR